MRVRGGNVRSTAAWMSVRGGNWNGPAKYVAEDAEGSDVLSAVSTSPRVADAATPRQCTDSSTGVPFAAGTRPVPLWCAGAGAGGVRARAVANALNHAFRVLGGEGGAQALKAAHGVGRTRQTRRRRRCPTPPGATCCGSCGLVRWQA